MASSRLPPERRSARRAVSRPSGGDAAPARRFKRADRAVHHERNRMMARSKRSRRSYSAGEWGRNRVRVFPDPKTGRYQIEWRENGRRLTRSLKHRDRSRAKRQADEVAAGFAVHEPNGQTEAEPELLTLGTLLDIYGDEVTPTKSERSRRYDRVAMKMFIKVFGRQRKPATLSQRDWDRFIRARRAGKVGPSRSPVSDRTIEKDLRFLLAVLNWATKSRDEEGKLLLDSNPLRGLKVPKEKNPTRVVLSQAEYEALLQASLAMDWRFRVALVVAHETGHRIGAVRQLRWSDIDMERRTIRWRGECAKTGYEHRTPVTAEVLAVLEEARRRNPGIGDAPLLPAPKNPSACIGRSLARDWWDRAEALAGLPPKRLRGWHSLRRKFASDLMNQPLKVLCELGGWKTAETVLQCYQRADEDRLRQALEQRQRTISR
ncbi:MAG: site-specific integrase [Gammaproteobacteria bacterium]|nr:site-specific integrase [Gammaproteobacteria bacterium]